MYVWNQKYSCEPNSWKAFLGKDISSKNTVIRKTQRKNMFKLKHTTGMRSNGFKQFMLILLEDLEAFNQHNNEVQKALKNDSEGLGWR